ncbi:STAS domain-containing protein [Actinoplanes sp. NBC_00393]|uniref:STAS domain-containing protein n=1 Tax=Actinoplanes sp. NBC_00393 TaxID=2975953 RepID=UPI002E23D45A
MQSDILTVRAQAGPESSVVLAATGEIDRDSRGELRRGADAALAEGCHRLVIDLGAVTFCDSSGLSLFIDLHRETLRRDGWLRLQAVPPHLQEMLRVTRLDEMLDVRD